MGNERGSSSRKGKKISEKPKQAQRGLGVAQLEKIRLHGQMPACSYHPNLHVSYPPAAHFNQEDMRGQASFSSLQLPSFSYLPASHVFPSTAMTGAINHNDRCERTEVRYIDSQPATASSWVPNINILEAQHFVQPNMSRHMMFNNVRVEDSLHLEGEKCKSRSMGSGSQNSNASDNQELDLELRLSL